MGRAQLTLLVLLAASCSQDPAGSSGRFADGGFVRFEAGPPVDAGSEDAGPADLGLVDGGADLGAPDLARDLGLFDQGLDLALPDMQTDPCTVLPVETLTASVAASGSRSELLGQPVRVRGRLEPGEPSCVPEACPPERPCCNQCSTDLRIDGQLRLLADDECQAQVGCAGSACGLICSPPAFGLVEGFVGRMELDGEEVVLRLLRVTP